MLKLIWVIASATLAATAPTARWVPDDTPATDALADIALENAAAFLTDESSGCTAENVVKRREWHDLSRRERKSWIKAVQCLYSLPSRIDAQLAPGARTRYDDFLAIHIIQGRVIHGTGNFLSWHRYYTWAFEEALRNECGYDGYQPYLNWAKLASDPVGAPLFDGSPSSIGNNGAFREHPGPTLGGVTVPVSITYPPADGGDCITAGPFANTTVNLGPVLPSLPYIPPNPLSSGLGYNPQCFIRDINPALSAQVSDAITAGVITGNTTIASFQTELNGVFAEGRPGIHASGHYMVGGSPAGDFFASPGDPYFWLHHAQIDRVWWMWQNQVTGKERDNVIFGGTILGENPPSRNATIDDDLDLGAGLLAETVKIKDVTRTTEGPFCYLYE